VKSDEKAGNEHDTVRKRDLVQRLKGGAAAFFSLSLWSFVGESLRLYKL
jgi:hypothetical protein